MAFTAIEESCVNLTSAAQVTTNESSGPAGELEQIQLFLGHVRCKYPTIC